MMTTRKQAGAIGIAGVLVAAGLRRRSRHPRPEFVPPKPRHRGGSGTPLLLLHGVGGTWHAWQPVLSLLEAHHDVLAPTLAGHGGADRLPPGTAPTIGALADVVEAELDAAGLGRVHVVGNSLGGWVALELARRGRARSVVLFSPAGAWRSQRRMDAVALIIRSSVALLARLARHADAIAARPALRRLLLSSQVAHPERVPAQVLADKIRASTDAPVVGPLLRLLPQKSIAALPPDRDYPVRVVWAEPDRVIPFEHFGAPMLERVPGAELRRIEGIGHVPMYDDPALVSDLILEVTRAVDRTASIR